METEKFDIIEDEDGIVIFDGSDDYDPGEEQILDENDELDIEYILRESKRQDALQARGQRKQRWISVAVIAVVASYIAGVCYINFEGIL